MVFVAQLSELLCGGTVIRKADPRARRGRLIRNAQRQNLGFCTNANFRLRHTRPPAVGRPPSPGGLLQDYIVIIIITYTKRPFRLCAGNARDCTRARGCRAPIVLRTNRRT